MFYLLLLPVCYLIYIASVESVDLVTADLGRHITNGRLILDAFSNGLDLHTFTPLFTNFYSYTLPAQETMNHHWLSGIVFHLLNELVGFDGLELINIFLIMLANIIFFFAAKERSNKYIALLALVIAIPITCIRREVRPESFSYVFMALVFLFITLFQNKKISKRTLFIVVPLIQLIWINMHLFFIFGLFTIGAFTFSALICKNKENSKVFLQLFGLSIAASLINPAHILGVIEPLMIFKGFGYNIAENQTVFFMQKRSPLNPLYPYFEALGLIGIGLIVVQYKKIKEENTLVNFVILLPLLIAGLKTNRIMPVTALYTIPVLASSVQGLINQFAKEKLKNFLNKAFTALSILITVFFTCLYFYYFGRTIEKYKFNPLMNNSAKFILLNNVPQPVFNNFDIGGYYIYHLFPKYRPFVDNRPEAYRQEFFDNYYNAMLKSEDRWYEVEKQFNFQTIYFMRQDATEYAQPFLIKRIHDPSWAPVYVDDWTIILVKRNAQNQALIQQHELPAGMFRAVKG